MADRVCVGVIVGPHGVKGVVRIKSFTERAADVAAYGPVEDEAGDRRFALAIIGEAKGVVTARVDGVIDRSAAERLKGSRLYVRRTALPALADDEFYYSDLVGLRAELADGTLLGRVSGVFDFGGGDVIEVAGAGGPWLFSFTRAVVPLVDIAGGRVLVAPPPETEADGRDADGS
jgi:16S rRNA processing protein RimM